MALNIADVRIAGVVENMGTMICSECGCKERMFIGAETVEELAERHGVPYLGAIPFSITLADSSVIYALPISRQALFALLPQASSRN